MKKSALFPAAFLIALAGFGQTEISPQKPERVPYFSSAQDSADYARAQRRIQEFRGVAGQDRKLDSTLYAEFSMAYKKIAGYKTVNLRHSAFTPWDSVRRNNSYDQVTLISFASGKVTELPADLWKCKNLEAIELFRTNIRTLPKELSQLPKLHTILINDNAEKIRFAKNTSIKTLLVRGTIPHNFKKLSGLEKLDLSYCGLTQLPRGLQKNKKLTQLLLNNNTIDLAQRKIYKRNTISHLEMQANAMKALPASIGRFAKLKTLVLNNNEISEISPAISHLKKLEQLALYRNNLAAIPSGIYGLPALREIDLYYNQIERVDERIGNLKSLEILYLSNNKLLSVPESIGSLPLLVELYLSYNRLTELPSSLENLERLRVLRINNNNLVSASLDLPKLISLENLDISKNLITELPEGIQSLAHLKLLVMLENPWEADALQQLPVLAKGLRDKAVIVHVEEDLLNR